MLSNRSVLFKDSRLPLRFWNKARIDSRGCWIWIGALDWHGYGQYWHERKQHGAHRLAFMILISDIPDGLHLDHLCRTPNCVNVNHLEAVTVRQNILRGVGPSALNAKKEYCPRGHSYSNENVRSENGRRYCRKCGAIRQREWRERKQRNEELT